MARIIGSIIHADKPVVTLLRPFAPSFPRTRRRYDHLESSMFPVRRSVRNTSMSLHAPRRAPVVEAYDNTSVAFDPPVSGRNGVLLNTGDVVGLPTIDKKSFATMVANASP
jgi:hypothetical protein